MKYEHVIEASQDAKQMEDTSILGGDPLDGRPCETCQCYTLGCGEDCREGDGHDSDCSTHNAPAYPAGDCDCSASLIKRLRKISADNKGPRDCIDEAADEIEKRNRNRNAVIEQCKRLAIQWGDARLDDHGGHALRNYAEALEALKSQPALCEDEGCPHHGAPHVCVSQPAAPDKNCEYCDGTGDVHTMTGEWRGVCTCEAGQRISAPDKCDEATRHRNSEIAAWNLLEAEREAMKLLQAKNKQQAEALEIAKDALNRCGFSDWITEALAAIDEVMKGKNNVLAQVE